MIFPLLGFLLFEKLGKKTTTGKVHTSQCTKQKHTVFLCVSPSKVPTTEAPHKHVVLQSKDKAAKHIYIRTSIVDLVVEQNKNSNSDLTGLRP